MQAEAEAQARSLAELVWKDGSRCAEDATGEEVVRVRAANEWVTHAVRGGFVFMVPMGILMIGHASTTMALAIMVFAACLEVVLPQRWRGPESGLEELVLLSLLQGLLCLSLGMLPLLTSVMPLAPSTVTWWYLVLAVVGIIKAFLLPMLLAPIKDPGDPGLKGMLNHPARLSRLLRIIGFTALAIHFTVVAGGAH